MKDYKYHIMETFEEMHRKEQVYKDLKISEIIGYVWLERVNGGTRYDFSKADRTSDRGDYRR
ncbi:MAG: hypothetical protein ACI4W2_08305 [Eubacterium sp.]